MTNGEEIKENEKITAKKERNSNIELLRIICAVMVIIFHTASGYGIVNAANTAPTVANWLIIRFLSVFSIVAVDVFILISGYFMINDDRRKIGKAITLFAVCAAYKAVPYLVLTAYQGIVLGNNAFSISTFFYNLFPRSYFIYFYCALYILSPYINRSIRSLSKKGHLRLVIITLFFFCVWSTGINVYMRASGNTDLIEISFVGYSGTDYGFTLITFIMLYIIGGYIGRFGLSLGKLSDGAQKYIFLAAYILISCVTSVLCLAAPKIAQTSSLLGYDSAFVVAAAVALFAAFLKMKPRKVKFINFLAKSTFGVYLLHEFVLEHLAVRTAEKLFGVEKLFSGNPFMALIAFLAIVLFAYIASAILDTAARFVFSPVTKLWKKTRLYNVDITAVKDDEKK